MGKSFFQSPIYGWRSFAAWFKLTNRVISGCGLDLFTQSYDTQSRCIFGYPNDRSEPLKVATSCIAQSLSNTVASTTTTTSQTTTTVAQATPSVATTCVKQAAQFCINKYSQYWPSCSSNQSQKKVPAPSGFEYGYYCEQNWVDSLNEMLSNPVVNMCGNKIVITQLLSQVAWETGYFSTVYQPIEGGAGLIHMAKINWLTNAIDMDKLWPGNDYAAKVLAMGKSFYQEPIYAWRSVAAWFKLTNRVVPGCGLDLFAQSYETQTRCIFGHDMDRSETLKVATSCIPQTLAFTANTTSLNAKISTAQKITTVVTTTPTTVVTNAPPTTTSTVVKVAQSQVCVLQNLQFCINNYSLIWPKCSSWQTKNSVGPSGYDFGLNCEQNWVDSLNEMLSNPVVNICNNKVAIAQVLAQVAQASGYYSAQGQLSNGGAGLLLMYPAYWAINAGDMDILWPGNDYVGKVLAMGKSFFQSPIYGWRSVAAWYKLTNRFMPGCGLDLFTQSYDTQTRCIFGTTNDRSEALNVATSCMTQTIYNTTTVAPQPINSTLATVAANKTTCVLQVIQQCINNQTGLWPKCSSGQSKNIVGLSGNEFGYYCDQNWVDSLNEMLSNPVINMCSNKTVITQLLAQVAWGTGYYSTVYQPINTVSGLINIIPTYWAMNAADMDILWPGNDYVGKVLAMGKSFFQSPIYSWRSLAAWYKLTNRVIPGCGIDLFKQSYEIQTRCIFGPPGDRNETRLVASSCMAQNLSANAFNIALTQSTTNSNTTATAQMNTTVVSVNNTAVKVNQVVGNGTCVIQAVQQCINNYSMYWPKCSSSQSKNIVGPSGYTFGLYCEKGWVDSLNEMISNPVINICGDKNLITQVLAQVAWETGYYSTAYQPVDGGAGLIHMISNNWGTNAADMDKLWPGNDYAGKVRVMGKDFFQSPNYAWRSVAAWYKLTNRVIPGCGYDLFTQSYETQSRCIFGYPNDRSETLKVTTVCMAASMNTTATNISAAQSTTTSVLNPNITTTQTNTAVAPLTISVSPATNNTVKVNSTVNVTTTPVSSPVFTSVISKTDQEAFDTLNLYRTNPAAALADIKTERALLNTQGYLTYPGEIMMKTQEGVAVYDDAIAAMEKQMPVSALKWNDALAKAAAFHNADIGPLGLVQHEDSDGTSFSDRLQKYIGKKGFGENIAFGNYTQGKRTVLELVVDDGVQSRGHRKNIFSPDYTHVGIATGPHKSFGQMMTMDFGINLVDTVAPVSQTSAASTSNSTVSVPSNSTAVKPLNDTIVSTAPFLRKSTCVVQAVQQCINGYSQYWPKCSSSQSKNVFGPSAYTFGLYCEQNWVDYLNEMLSNPVVNICSNQTAIAQVLAQVAWETGYYSTTYQPVDGGVGLIHMISNNWGTNAADMDKLWPGNDYAGKVRVMGKDFFQSPNYAWRSVAAWYKLTNRVIPGCGYDLFTQSYETQSRCIFGQPNDRTETLKVTTVCIATISAINNAQTTTQNTTATTQTTNTVSPQTNSTFKVNSSVNVTTTSNTTVSAPASVTNVTQLMKNVTMCNTVCPTGTILQGPCNCLQVPCNCIPLPQSVCAGDICWLRTYGTKANPFMAEQNNTSIVSVVGDKMYFMLVENASTGNKIIVDIQALNGTINFTETYQSLDVTVDGVNLLGSGEIRLFNVTSVKEGSGVFRLVNANPNNYNSSWATYDPKQKWSYSVQVLPTVSSVGKNVTVVPLLPPVFISPTNCVNKTCAPNQVMSPVDCACSDFSTVCPLQCSAGFTQKPDCTCVLTPTKRNLKRSRPAQ